MDMKETIQSFISRLNLEMNCQRISRNPNTNDDEFARTANDSR